MSNERIRIVKVFVAERQTRVSLLLVREFYMETKFVSRLACARIKTGSEDWGEWTCIRIYLYTASLDIANLENFTIDLSSLRGEVFNSAANGFAAVCRAVCKICYTREIRISRNETSCLSSVRSRPDRSSAKPWTRIGIKIGRGRMCVCNNLQKLIRALCRACGVFSSVFVVIINS